MRMNIVVISGSTRNGRFGDTVAQWIVNTIKKRGDDVQFINPNDYDELLVVRTPHHRSKDPSEQMHKVHTILEEADGFVLVTPEYNHSFTGAIKNILDNFMPEYRRKPFAIASYSSGAFGGIRANEALRPVISELKGVPTPIPLLLPSVKEIFDENGQPKEELVNERLGKFLDDFDWYVKALKTARES